MRINMNIWEVESTHYDCPEHKALGPTTFENFDTCNICHYFWMRFGEDLEATQKDVFDESIIHCDCEICEV
jgi:hypothetical protein